MTILRVQGLGDPSHMRGLAPTPMWAPGCTPRLSRPWGWGRWVWACILELCPMGWCRRQAYIIRCAILFCTLCSKGTLYHLISNDTGYQKYLTFDRVKENTRPFFRSDKLITLTQIMFLPSPCDMWVWILLQCFYALSMWDIFQSPLFLLFQHQSAHISRHIHIWKGESTSVLCHAAAC